MPLAEVIARVVRQNALPGNSAIDADTDLLERGVLDSLGIMAVAADLETELGCLVLPADILPENFRTLSDIVRMVEKTQRGFE